MITNPIFPPCNEAGRFTNKNTTAASQRRPQNKSYKTKLPPNAPAASSAGDWGRKAPIKLVRSFSEKMNVSEPVSFSGSEMRLNGSGPFKQSLELKIKGDLISEAAAEEIIGELQALFARHNAGAALSAKAVVKPTKEFHTARHTLYSAEENMEIDKVVPVAGSVKTKLGRGGSGKHNHGWLGIDCLDSGVCQGRN